MFFREARLDENFGYCKIYLPKSQSYMTLYLQRAFDANRWTMFISETTLADYFPSAFRKIPTFDSLYMCSFGEWYKTRFPGEITPGICVYITDLFYKLDFSDDRTINEVTKAVRDTFNGDIEIDGIQQHEEKRELPVELTTKDLIHQAYEYWHSKSIEKEVEKQLQSKKRRLKELLDEELIEGSSRSSLRGSVIKLDYGDK